VALNGVYCEGSFSGEVVDESGETSGSKKLTTCVER
jgi:hypothetical protein